MPQPRHVPREDLSVMIEPFEPRDDPSAVRLEEDDAQIGKAFADAARQEERHRVHHVERVRDGLREVHVVDVDGVVAGGEVAHAEPIDPQAEARSGEIGREERMETDGEPGVRAA